MIRSSSKQHRRRPSRGFSLIELVIVVAIALLVMSMAVPGIRASLQTYAQRSAITSVTGAIQAARYQAIFQGCKYQLVFTAASSSYTVANQVPAVGSSTCQAAFSAPGAAIPLSGSGASLGGDVTLQFLPNGTVQSVPAGAITIAVTYPGRTTETISVTTYGKISVYP